MTSARPPLPPPSVRLDDSSGEGLRAYLLEVVKWNREQRAKREQAIQIFRGRLRG